MSFRTIIKTSFLLTAAICSFEYTFEFYRLGILNDYPFQFFILFLTRGLLIYLFFIGPYILLKGCLRVILLIFPKTP